MPTTTEPTPAPASQVALATLLCEVLPPQGAWSDREYLWLTDHTNRLIELSDGRIQDLPMPTDTHQAVLQYLYLLFRDYLKPRGGVARVAALRMRVRAGTFREPDLLITVLALHGGAYVEHGAFARGKAATSSLLEGFVADVAAVFDAPESGE